MNVEEKLLEYGFTRVSDETHGGVWHYGEGDEALKLFIFEKEYHLLYPRSSKMRKKSFQFRGFPESMIEKHICLSVMKE